MRFSKVICSLISAAWLLISAEPTAKILGTVHDSSGAVVPNVKMVVVEVQTGLRRVTVSSADGAYIVPLLPVGRYTLTAESQNFKKYVREGIILSVNENARVDVSLELGAVAESVKVNGDATMVDTANAALKEVVDPMRMQNLPVNGRDILQFQYLLPGVHQDVPETQALTGPFTPVSASWNGARGASGNYLLDGGESTDENGGGLPAPYPNPDALEEFAVLSSAFSAENGRYAGGLVTAVTKSGTNQYHGDLFEFLRNDALNARSFFSLSNPPYKQNQFGFTLGGPLTIPKIYNAHDKLFFFVGYQGTRIHQAPTVSSAVVPTALERQGNFSQSTQKPTDPTTKALFPGNTIPMSRIDPAALAVLDKWVPMPNAANGRYIFNEPNINDTDQVVTKIDYQLSTNNRLSGRYLYQDQFYRNFTSTLPGFFSNKGLRFQNLLLSDTYTIRPNLLNDFHASYLRYLDHEFPGGDQSYADVGIHVFMQPPVYPSLSVSGYFSAAVRRPQNEASNMFQYADTLTFIHDRHMLKFGADLHREQFNSILGQSTNPDIGFDGSISGNAYADFLLGRPNTLTQSNTSEFAARRWSWSFFAQDDWKVTPRLTLNLGLRYDPLTPVTDLRNRIAAYRPGEQSKVFPLAPVGLVFPGDPGVPDATFGADLNNWAPRVGLAWDPTGSGKWSIRSAYGIFYDLERPISIGQFTTQQPWNLTTTLFDPASLSNPYQGINNPYPYTPPTSPSAQKAYQFVLPIITDVIDPNFKSAYVQQWNLSIQHEIAKDFLITMAYAGSKGTDLHYDVEINPAVYEGPSSSTANTNARRPLAPTYASLSENRSGANSIYNSFQSSLNKRFSHGHSILASYTFSKSIDTISTGREGQFKRITNPYDLNAYRGLSDFNYPNRFVASWIWQIPVFQSQKGLAGRTLGGWSLNGIATVQSGQPYSVTSGTDRSLSAVGGDMADLIGNPLLPPGQTRGAYVHEAFNVAAFAPAALGTFGSAGRNILKGYPTENCDLSLTKEIPFTERYRMEFRAEYFDVFNRPTLALPVSTASSKTLGQITSAGAGRVGQLALKLFF